MTVRILNCDVMEGLRQLSDESVHCVVTSPPYFGLRSYLRDDHPMKAFEIGSEPTLAEHIEKLVEVFREVRRVLRSDGICWMNYGDAYCNFDKWGGGGGNSGKQTKHGDSVPSWAVRRRKGKKDAELGLKPKDLMLIPYRLAIALMEDGWWLRSRIPWLKPNGMPSSVEDRPGTSIEDIFMLTKSARYFYDGEAVKQIAKYPAGQNSPQSNKSPYGQGMTRRAQSGKNERSEGQIAEASASPRAGFNERWDNGSSDGQRALRQSDLFFSALGDVRGSVATRDGELLALHVATQPYAEAHFATFPPRLIEPLILAGTSAKGCCSACGAPYVREIERIETGFDGSRYGERAVEAAGGALSGGTEKSTLGSSHGTLITKTRTIGWNPSCECFIDDKGVIPPPIARCIVLDPFMGAGTTGLVADRLQRDAIGIELSDEHTERADRRVADDRPGPLLDIMEGAE